MKMKKEINVFESKFYEWMFVFVCKNGIPSICCLIVA